MELRIYNTNIKPDLIDDKIIRQGIFTTMRRCSRASKASVIPDSDVYCPPYEKEFSQLWDKYIMKEDFAYFSVHAPKFFLKIPVVLADSNPFLDNQNKNENTCYCIILAALNSTIELQKSIMNNYRFSQKIDMIVLNNNVEHQDASVYSFIHKEQLYPDMLKDKIEVRVLELDVYIYRHLIMYLRKELAKEFWSKIYNIVSVITPDLLSIMEEHVNQAILFGEKKEEEHFEVRKNIYRIVSEQNISQKRVNMSYDFLLNQKINDIS